MATRVNSAGKRVLYFYGVSQSQADAPGSPGVDLKSPVEALSCEKLICWISRVPAEDFEANLNKNMENLDWLATASVAHQRTIAAVAAKTDILPARFGTIFRNESSLLAHIRAHAKDFSKDFKRVKDADEWGIKVFAEEPAQPALKNVKSGRDYLKAKAALLPRRRERGAKVDEDVVEFGKALENLAEETAPAGNISGGQRGLVFQSTLLVKRSQRARLENTLQKFTKRWSSVRRIECTGPWPPYSFVSRNGAVE